MLFCHLKKLKDCTQDKHNDDSNDGPQLRRSKRIKDLELKKNEETKLKLSSVLKSGSKLRGRSKSVAFDPDQIAPSKRGRGKSVDLRPISIKKHLASVTNARESGQSPSVGNSKRGRGKSIDVRPASINLRHTSPSNARESGQSSSAAGGRSDSLDTAMIGNQLHSEVRHASVQCMIVDQQDYEARIHTLVEKNISKIKRII